MLHENIIKYISIFEDIPAIAFEYAENGDLNSILERSASPIGH
jgi:hypothetical protein